MLKKTVIFTITLVVLFCQNLKTPAMNENEVKAIIVKHSIELGIEPALALSIAKTESGFRHTVKSNGPVGVYQLMPDTARRLGVNPYYLSDNIKGGLMYYKRMYQLFGSTELALAAYNSGPVAVSRQKTVPNSSRSFVNKIMSDYNNYKKNPDQSMIQAQRKAPKQVSMPKPKNNLKPSVRTNPVSVNDGKDAGLSKHTIQMLDVSM